MIYLTKIDPAKNMHRYYRLTIEPTLFGDFALVREWGRIGAKRGSSKEHHFAELQTVENEFVLALRSREMRGYNIVSANRAP